VDGDREFLAATKAIHNGLQGAARRLSERERHAYLDGEVLSGAAFGDAYDVIVVHDPSVAGVSSHRRSPRSPTATSHCCSAPRPAASFMVLMGQTVAFWPGTDRAVRAVTDAASAYDLRITVARCGVWGTVSGRRSPHGAA
jgi:hypothetical protein